MSGPAFVLDSRGSTVIMALVDSQATFQLHCDKIDPSGWLKRMMAQNQLRTFSDLGFAVGTPQAPASTSEFDTFCNQLNGNVDMSISEVSRVRRLHFEACTLIVAHTKQQVSLDSSVEGKASRSRETGEAPTAAGTFVWSQHYRRTPTQSCVD